MGVFFFRKYRLKRNCIEVYIQEKVHRKCNQHSDQERERWEFPGSPVVGTRCFHCCGLDSVPGWVTNMLPSNTIDYFCLLMNFYKV